MAAAVPRQAVHGLGGVGKTELALEYAHRFASDYDVIWWVPSDHPTAVSYALARLALRLGVPEQADQSAMITALFDELRQRDRWLIVYDNAEQPTQLKDLLPPGGGGHVLVTSRWHAWGNFAASLQLTVMRREESLTFLSRRTGLADEAELRRVAELLGDLPLALEEAAAYLEQTGEDLRVYIGLLHDRAAELFLIDAPYASDSNQRRVATVWSVSLDRVRIQAPEAEALLNLFAFLAPDVPRDLPAENPLKLPTELARTVNDRLAYNQVIMAIGRFSLAAK